MSWYIYVRHCHQKVMYYCALLAYFLTCFVSGYGVRRFAGYVFFFFFVNQKYHEYKEHKDVNFTLSLPPAL